MSKLVKVGNLEVDLEKIYPSGWKVVGSESHEATAGVGGVAVGLGHGSFNVQVTEGAHRRAQTYRLTYVGKEVSGGFSPKVGPSATHNNPINWSISPSWAKSGSYGQIYRLPTSPNPAGEGGPPTGFRGPILFYSLGAGAVIGTSQTLMLLGCFDMPGRGRACKYVAIAYGFWIGLPSIGETLLDGYVTALDEVS